MKAGLLMKKRKSIKKNEKINIFNNSSMQLFTMFCGYFLLILFFYSLSQFINYINLNLIYAISIISPIACYLIVCKDKTIKTKISIITIFSCFVLILPFLYNKTYDLTFDGNSYHKSAIAFIRNGWNPLYEEVEEFQNKSNTVIKIDKTTKLDLWMNHYPKATWIIAGTIYSYTGNIESGKCITLILNLMLVILTFNILLPFIGKKHATLLSFLIAINPITIVQIFSYYVDGIMGILFAIEIMLLSIVNPKEKLNIWNWLCIASIASIMVNIKFTGLLCSGVIAAVYYFYWLIRERKNPLFLKIFKKITLSFTIVYVIAIFLVGANSYMKNLVINKNPIYPLAGKDKVDIVTPMQPKSFKRKTKLEKFIISSLSRSENVTYDGTPQIKIPFRIYKKELSITEIPDARIGGFGPLFTFVLIGSVILLIIGLYKLYIYDRNLFTNFVLPLCSILLSMILIGECWWARYIPQLYLIPLISIIVTLYDNKKSNLKRIMSIGIILLLIINSAFFGYGFVKSIKRFANTSYDLKEMHKKDLILKLNTEELYGVLYTLKDNGINYVYDKELKEEECYYKYDWKVLVKKNETISETN